MTRTSKLQYQSVWVSPRGFANEGSYVYGLKAEIEQLFERYRDSENAGWDHVSYHRTVDAAQGKCERLSRRDHTNTPSHELCCIDAVHVSEML